MFTRWVPAPNIFRSNQAQADVMAATLRIEVRACSPPFGILRHRRRGPTRAADWLSTNMETRARARDFFRDGGGAQ
jgi:hypothetical protein